MVAGQPLVSLGIPVGAISDGGERCLGQAIGKQRRERPQVKRPDLLG